MKEIVLNAIYTFNFIVLVLYDLLNIWLRLSVNYKVQCAEKY